MDFILGPIVSIAQGVFGLFRRQGDGERKEYKQ